MVIWGSVDKVAVVILLHDGPVNHKMKCRGKKNNLIQKQFSLWLTGKMED